MSVFHLLALSFFSLAIAPPSSVVGVASDFTEPGQADKANVTVNTVDRNNSLALATTTEQLSSLKTEETEEEIISSMQKRKDWRPFKVLMIAPTSAPSHFQLNAKLAELLCKRGHDVVGSIFL